MTATNDRLDYAYIVYWSSQKVDPKKVDALDMTTAVFSVEERARAYVETANNDMRRYNLPIRFFYIAQPLGEPRYDSKR